MGYKTVTGFLKKPTKKQLKLYKIRLEKEMKRE